MGRGRWWAVVLFSSWGIFASPVLAQQAGGEPPPQAGERSDLLKKKASEHFERGVQLFRDGAYRAALIEFERAYQTLPDFRLLYNQAQMRMLLQDYLGATRDYERYLVEGGAAVSADRRETVEHELEVLRTRVARISIKTTPEHAKVYVDDAVVGETPLAATIPLNVGRHRVYAEAADGSSAALVVDLAAGELHEVNLELKAPKVKTVVMRDENAPVKPGAKEKKYALVTAIGAGLIGAVALGTGLAATQAQDDFEKKTNTIPVSPADITNAKNKAHRLAVATDVLLVPAAALAVTSVVLWVVGAKRAKNDKAKASAWDLEVGWNSIGAQRRF
jgi:hypothetical protein